MATKPAPTTDSEGDLLALLSQVSGESGITATEEIVTEAELPPAAPIRNTDVDVAAAGGTTADDLEGTTEIEIPEDVLYAEVTINGLKRYRPDLVQALQKSAPAAKAPPAGTGIPRPAPKVAKGEGAIGKFRSYYDLSTGMLQTDASSVSTRRLANMKAMYVEALKEAQVPLGDRDVNFVINGARIDAVWAGIKPTLPEQLDV